MAKGMKTYHPGSRTRRVQCSCGWSRQGVVKDVNSAINRHRKYCDSAKNIPPPEFNEAVADANGLMAAKEGRPLHLAQRVSEGGQVEFINSFEL